VTKYPERLGASDESAAVDVSWRSHRPRCPPHGKRSAMKHDNIIQPNIAQEHKDKRKDNP